MNPILKICLLIALTMFGVSSLAQSPRGEYREQGQFKGFYDPSMFTKGCEIPGVSKDKTEVDSTLPVGLTITDSAIQKSEESEPFYLVTDTKINSISKTGYSTTTTAVKSSGVPALPPSAVTHQECNLVNKPNMSYFDCKSSPVDMMKLNWKRECTAIGGETVNVPTSYGTFKLADGKTVNAFFMTGIWENAKIKCYDPTSHGSETDEGVGEVIRTVIRSNEVPTTSANHCGGTSVYIFQKAVNSKGQVLENSSYEVLGFK